MSKHPMQGLRSTQILLLLSEHGPLSIRGLEKTIEPEIKRRRIGNALKRLQNSGRITKINDKIFGGHGVYYQLARDPVSTLIGEVATKHLYEGDYQHILVRHEELLHSELCAVWTEILKRRLPGAAIIREFFFPQNPIAKNVLISNDDGLKIRPDMLIVIPKTSDSERVCVGVEIERTQKSERRIVIKMRKFARQTLLDGVIYICQGNAMADKVRRTFLTKVAPETVRVSKYAKNFVVFANPSLGAEAFAQMSNSAHETVSLQHWVTQLVARSVFERRDVQFEERACGDSPNLEQLNSWVLNNSYLNSQVKKPPAATSQPFSLVDYSPPTSVESSQRDGLGSGGWR